MGAVLRPVLEAKGDEGGGDDEDEDGGKGGSLPPLVELGKAQDVLEALLKAVSRQWLLRGMTHRSILVVPPARGGVSNAANAGRPPAGMCHLASGSPPPPTRAPVRPLPAAPRPQRALPPSSLGVAPPHSCAALTCLAPRPARPPARPPQAVESAGADKAAELWRLSGLEAARFMEMEEDLEGLVGDFPFLAPP